MRWWLVGVGITCIGLGGIGALVPGLPTTIFLIIASWCFMRSCPVLERVLIRNRFFGPFLRYLSPGAVMPTRARVITTMVLWTAVLTSISLLYVGGAGPWLLTVIAISAAIGSFAVWRVARPDAEQSAGRVPTGSA